MVLNHSIVTIDSSEPGMPMQETLFLKKDYQFETIIMHESILNMCSNKKRRIFTK